MRRREKTLSAIMWTLTIMAAIFLGIVIFYVFTRDDTKTYVKERDAQLVDTEASGTIDTGYAAETSYSGDTYVPASLFKHPFRKTNAYIPNKEYINTIGPENAAVLSKRTEEAMEKAFNITFSSIEKTDYLETLNNYFVETNVLVLDKLDIYAEYNEEIADTIVNLAKDNNLVMEANCYTNHCMVYYDEGSIIVRSKVLLEVYSCTDLDKLSAFLGADKIELGKPFGIIYETYLTTDVIMGDYPTYKIHKTLPLDIVE